MSDVKLYFTDSAITPRSVHRVTRVVKIVDQDSLCVYRPKTVASPTRRRLQAWLKASRRSQAALAKELGLSTAYVSMLLKGQRTPSLPVAKQLQELTGIPATEFVPTRVRRTA